MHNERRLLTVRELAEYLCVSESTVRKMVRESRIPFTKILSKILFNKSIIDDWLVNNQCGMK